ncbi:glutamic acid-rich protein-like [Chelonus insularis]|nr:glutamic acid-rich protein-like [Chelonus insularis]
MSVIDIKFTKFDNTPWGFRLVGGSDFPQPLTVIKVVEGSLAECMGLKVGDVVVRLNDNTVSSLTHGQAHEALKLAGNNFTLGVFRKKEEEEITTTTNLPEETLEPYQIPLEELKPVIPLDDLSSMICNSGDEDNRNKLVVEEFYEEITESKVEQENPEPEQEVLEEKPVDANSEVVPNKNLTDDEIAQLILEEEELLLAKGDQAVLGVNFKKLRPRAPLLKESKVLEELQSIALEDPPKVQELKHQSTFLQKPSRPIPTPKKLQNETPEQNGGYKVVIKKQMKKSVTERLLQKGLLDPEALKNQKSEQNSPSITPEPVQSEPKTTIIHVDRENNDYEEENKAVNQEHQEEEQKNEEKKESEEEERIMNGECVVENNTSVNGDIDESEKKSIECESPTQPQTCKLTSESLVFDKQKIQELVSTEISLEKQLENVQNQLLALKQLPAEIENHLKIVSEQLFKIMELSGVNSRRGSSDQQESKTECEPSPPSPEEENPPSEEIEENHCESDKDETSTAERSSSAMSYQQPQIILEEDQEEIEPPEVKELEVTVKSDDNRVKKCIASYETRVFRSRDPSPATSHGSYEPDPNLSPKDQVIQELKHRGVRKRSHDLWPQAKQLELTYGRRWRCPNDFFNDEMIAEVLSGQAEVIRGRALGVNFKKYEKEWLPNYDHLMNSSVYKMLHKMEKEPKSGIPARPPKVPAAEDIIERVNTPA